MKIQPLEMLAGGAAQPGPAPREDRCETCHFWDRAQMQQQDRSQPAVAPCLRYPPVIVVVPVPVMNSRRMIVNPNEPIPTEPRPMPVLPFSSAVAWCGEHKPRVPVKFENGTQ